MKVWRLGALDVRRLGKDRRDFERFWEWGKLRIVGLGRVLPARMGF